ncbi:hypothetical protein V5799_024977, partial [Amblyomma americanum]
FLFDTTPFTKDTLSDEHSAPVRVLGQHGCRSHRLFFSLIYTVRARTNVFGRSNVCTSRAFFLLEYNVTPVRSFCVLFFPFLFSEPCLIPGLKTTKGPLNSGCKIECIDGSRQRLKNGTECLDVPLRVIKRMPNYIKFYCPLGTCERGVCRRNKTIVVCQKFPVYWITPPGH